MAFKIRNKLLIAFMAILLPFFILTIINHYYQRIIYNATHEVHTVSEEIQKIGHLQLNLNKAIMSVNDYIITGDKIYIDNFKRELANIENELKELKEIETGVSDRHIEIHRRIDKELEIIRDVETTLKGIEELSNKIFGITDPVGNKEAARLMEELDYKITYPAIKKLDVYHEIEKEDYREAIRISENAWERSWIIRITGTIIVIGISIFFALFYSRLFVLPIKQVHNGADAIAKGDFKVRLDIKTGDEIEQLSKAMNEMAKQLDTLYLNMDAKIEEGIRKFTAITESANDAIIVLSSPDVIHFWNKKAEEIFGYSADDVLGKSVHEIVVPQNFREKAKDGLNNFFKTGKGPVVGKVVEVFGMHKDGREFPIELSVSAVRIGEEWQAVGIIRDITERKRAEEELNREKKKAEKYLDIADVVIIAIDSNGRISLINKKGCEVLGYQTEDVVGKDWFDNFIPQNEKDVVRNVFNQLMAGNLEKGRYFENFIVNKSGEEKLITWHNTVLTDDRGRITGTLSSGEDITDKKEVERALMESEGKYRGIFENTTNAIVIFDSETWRFEDVNKAAQNLYGYTREEFLSLTPMDVSAEIEKSRKALQDGVADKLSHIPLRYHKKKDGTVFPLEIFAGTFISAGRKKGFAVIVDLTEYKKSEETLKQRLDELEQFRKVTIQRELRMEELKRKNKELEEELKILRGMR